MSDRCKVPTIVYVVNIFVASGMCLLLLTVASYGQLSKLIEEQSVEKKLAIRIVATTSVLACIGPVTSILVSVCGLPMSCCKATPCIKNTQMVIRVTHWGLSWVDSHIGLFYWFLNLRSIVKVLLVQHFINWGTLNKN